MALEAHKIRFSYFSFLCGQDMILLLFASKPHR
jgi:hypothetical protein